MNVTKDLIEKYHQGLCSADEMKAVEQWLASDEDDQIFIPESLAAQKGAMKGEIWQQLQSGMLQPTAETRLRKSKNIYWLSTAAAVLLFICVTIWRSYHTEPTPLATFALPTDLNLALLKTDVFDIEIGSESKAFYDDDNDIVDFSGMIKIVPKQDLRLTFASASGNAKTWKEGIDIKEGVAYFAFNLKDQGHTELLVMDEDKVFELPPVVRNSLIAQFGI